LIKTGQDHEAPLRIVETVVAVNDQGKRAMVRKVAAALGGNLRGRTVAVVGVTFEPNTGNAVDCPDHRAQRYGRRGAGHLPFRFFCRL
jgi:UDPglucose 6-dehydrogenase